MNVSFSFGFCIWFNCSATIVSGITLLIATVTLFLNPETTLSSPFIKALYPSFATLAGSDNFHPSLLNPTYLLTEEICVGSSGLQCRHCNVCFFQFIYQCFCKMQYIGFGGMIYSLPWTGVIRMQ
jgi:hypothetical protein